MNYIKNQKGAMLVVELMVLAAVLVVAGLAGYQYMKNAKAVSKATTPKPHVVAKASPSPSVTPTKTADELDVTQLGFKMTLPQGLTGLTYTVDPSHTGTANNQTYSVSVARFTTQYLQDNGCYAGNIQTNPDAQIGNGSIARYSQDPETLGIMDLGQVEQVGSFWLEFDAPQATCGGNATVNGTQTQMIKLLGQAFETSAPLN